jgi:GNAT superfamily N-acetyltransferase
MKIIRLKSITDNYFQIAWKLYEEAFPAEERRLIDAQSRVMEKPSYHFDIIIHDNQFIGFFLWWDFENHRYIDHFATATQHRNKGFGKLILEQFMDGSKPILLEVELPDSPINQRRINFYERIGLKLNQHYYEVPSSEKGHAPFQLLLMSYPTLLSETDVEQFVKRCHPIIFES